MYRIGWEESDERMVIRIYYKEKVDIDVKLPDKIRIIGRSNIKEILLCKEVDSYEINRFENHLELILMKKVPEEWGELEKKITTPKERLSDKYDISSLDPEENEKDGLDALRTIYAQLPPAKRRAMMESYLKTQGQCIDTNWCENNL